MRKNCFFFFQICFKSKFWKLFCSLLKHYKNRGFCNCCVLVLKREEKKQKNDNLNFGVWVLGSKNGRFMTVNCFSFLLCCNPYFIVFWGCQKRFFGPNKDTDTLDWQLKSILGGMFVFLLFLFPFFSLFLVLNFFEGLSVRWGGPKGHQVSSLGPKPSLFLFWCFCLFCVFFSCFCFRTKKPAFPTEKGHFCLFLIVSFVSP